MTEHEDVRYMVEFNYNHVYDGIFYTYEEAKEYAEEICRDMFQALDYSIRKIHRQGEEDE